MKDVTVTEFVFVSGDSCETFCQDCGQLRLWGKPEKPEGCGNCGSAKIVVGPLLGQELPRLREAWRMERMSTSAREFRLPVDLPTVIIDLSQTEVVLTGGEDD